MDKTVSLAKVPNSKIDTSNSTIENNFLVFRNNPSWRRPTDFENVLSEFGYNHEQYESNKMAEVNLSNYNVIIIPGAQNKEYYNDYIKNIERYDEYVKMGGTLLLELNGAEKHDSINLPRGVTISLHKALENTIVQPEHSNFNSSIRKVINPCSLCKQWIFPKCSR